LVDWMAVVNLLSVQIIPEVPGTVGGKVSFVTFPCSRKNKKSMMSISTLWWHMKKKIYLQCSRGNKAKQAISFPDEKSKNEALFT